VARALNTFMIHIEVKHLPEQARFEAVVDGETAFLTYTQTPGRVAMTHTIVPAEIGRRGVAGQLTATAVGWAREQGLEIDPQCSYVARWLRQHG